MRPANMKPGDFYGTCARRRNDPKGIPADADTFCSEEFHTFADAEAHMKAVHPKLYRERLKPPAMVKPRAQPFGKPAVKLEKQRAKPGTPFTFQGYPCQVVGAASSTRTRYLTWLPFAVDPQQNGARKHWEMGPDENGLWLWEVTAPTHLVEKAISCPL
ncbi:hypothetical protein ACIQFP_10465 [Nocardiopsis alba]|uniref:hypothetical protein n=1 Tax=Nocardiopsis alba TaxID=53437 RepID=UPI0037F56750